MESNLIRINLNRIIIFIGFDGILYTMSKKILYLIKNDLKRGPCDAICDRCGITIKEDEYSYSCDIDNVDICIDCRNTLINNSFLT